MKNKKKLYYIYEIPNKKVGCTTDVRQRLHYRQKCKNYRILLITNSLKLASKREREFQKKLGYKVDNIDYVQSVKNRVKAAANTDYKAARLKAIESVKKPVLQYTKDGKFIKEWPSGKDAGRTLKIDQGNITQCCKGKRYCSVGGYVWKYKL